MKGGGMFDNLFNPSEWSIFNPSKWSFFSKSSDTPASTPGTIGEINQQTNIPTEEEEPIVDSNAVNTNNLNTSGPPGLSGLTGPSGETKTGGWMWGGKKRRNKKNKTAKNSGLKKGGGRK
jgi:hypothetical protein